MLDAGKVKDSSDGGFAADTFGRKFVHQREQLARDIFGRWLCGCCGEGRKELHGVLCGPEGTVGSQDDGSIEGEERGFGAGEQLLRLAVETAGGWGEEDVGSLKTDGSFGSDGTKTLYFALDGEENRDVVG
jgi:hypothetical protein